MGRNPARRAAARRRRRRGGKSPGRPLEGWGRRRRGRAQRGLPRLLLGTAALAADPAFTFDLTVDGEHTKTVAPGDIVTDPRSQAYYIVTEYGGVNLVGCSTWERAEKLISIAHPDFREELIRAAEQQKIWYPHNRR